MAVRISFEGKIGIVLALVGLAGTGLLGVKPDLHIVGWGLIAIAVLGGLVMCAYHSLDLWENRKATGIGRMVAFGGIVLSAVALCGFAAWHFWSAKKIEAAAPPTASAAKSTQNRGATPRQTSEDKLGVRGVIGARSKDKPGRTTGPLPTRDAIKAVREAKSPYPPAPPAPLRLRRLISYTPPFVWATRPDDKSNVLNRLEIALKNVSDETITVRVTWPKVEIDGETVITQDGDVPWKVIAQGDAINFILARNVPLPLLRSMKVIHIFVRVEYDTIPATGVRISERDVTQAFVWRDSDGAVERFDTTDLKEIER